MVCDPRKWHLSYDDRILLLALLAAFPGTIASLVLLWIGPYPVSLQALLSLLICAWWAGAAAGLRKRVVHPLRTVASLLGGLREGDFSIRGRVVAGSGALDEIFREINSLAETLREQRLGAVEATALLRTVMGEIDVAIFAFDGEQRLQLVNRAGERLLAKPAEQLLGQNAEQLLLAEHLAGEKPSTRQASFPAGSGRWGIRRTTFRERGQPHQLLVISDLTRELREEELQAWQRLVRVLGHELNNSLTPIKSIACTLQSIVAREAPEAEWKEDVRRGLEVVSARAESLRRFLNGYAQLARLPEPQLNPIKLDEIVQRVARLETRTTVKVVPAPPLTLRADGDQIEQMLINLVRNAVDAVLELPDRAGSSNGSVTIAWEQRANIVELRVEDEGPGLSNSANLFVPFFTTKASGSGIGLVLCRRIAEAHGGSLTLENREHGPGCVARLQLPTRKNHSNAIAAGSVPACESTEGSTGARAASIKDRQ